MHNLEITHKKPIHLGDRSFVKTWVDDTQSLRTVYGFQVKHGADEVGADGTTMHIVVKKENGRFRPVHFKKAFPEWYRKYEAIKRT